MFLEKTRQENEKLIACAFDLHQRGLISPDTYILDLDMIRRNGEMMLKEAQETGVKLFFMTKQFGRNPLVATMLQDLGFDGAVAVDFREAETLRKAGIQLGNVGHIVQIPKAQIPVILEAKPHTLTVYTLEKMKEIDEAAKALERVQDITLRIIGKEDFLYPGQYGGFTLEELPQVVETAKSFTHVRISGVTSFPCFLYSEMSKKVESTPNLKTVLEGKRQLEELGLTIKDVNLPSVTTTATLKAIRNAGGTHGEPGHSLTGTTPYHRQAKGEESPAMVYVSEVSHQLEGMSYAYGGGSYARSHVAKALVGKNLEDSVITDVIPPRADNIDYYIALEGNHHVSDTVVMAFRTQIFVTRSHVAVVDGIQQGTPKLLGIFDAQGSKLDELAF